MIQAHDDSELIECFNLIYELYPPAPRRGETDARDRVPSLVEGREMLRAFTRIESPEMRTAVRMLLRTLAPPATCDDPSAPHPSVANRPAGSPAS